MRAIYEPVLNAWYLVLSFTFNVDRALGFAKEGNP